MGWVAQKRRALRRAAVVGIGASGLLLASGGLPAAAATVPINGTFTTLAATNGVDHLNEQGCGPPYAGSESSAGGSVSPYGVGTGTLSTHWDWGTSAPGAFTPTGATTGFSATVLTGSYTSCFNATFTATGVANIQFGADTLQGQVSGGEIYEIDSGAGQESFIVVTVTGGTGQFATATGSYVTHSVVSFTSGLVSSELTGTLEFPDVGGIVATPPAGSSPTPVLGTPQLTG
jgi:hypothetical protein